MGSSAETGKNATETRGIRVGSFVGFGRNSINIKNSVNNSNTEDNNGQICKWFGSKCMGTTNITDSYYLDGQGYKLVGEKTGQVAEPVVVCEAINGQATGNNSNQRQTAQNTDQRVNWVVEGNILVLASYRDERLAVERRLAEERRAEERRLAEEGAKIYTAKGFFAFSHKVCLGLVSSDINVILMNDIDLNEGVIINGDGSINVGPAQTWLPIGTVDHPYSGTFDGNGRTIRGLYADFDCAGLFAYVSGNVTLKNLKIENSCLIGKIAGGLIGVVKKDSTVNIIDCEFLGGVIGRAVETDGKTVEIDLKAGKFVGYIEAGANLSLNSCKEEKFVIGGADESAHINIGDNCILEENETRSKKSCLLL